MRTLKLQVQVSIDGFIAGPNGEMDWMVWDWDDELKDFTTQLTESIDCIVLGKSFAQGFIPHWQKVAQDADNPEQEFGQKIVDVQKLVFSKNPAAPPAELDQWNNAKWAGTSLADGINKLKKEEGNDIIAYGGSEFVSSLIKEALIDELHLFVNPVALGNGMPIFHQLTNKQTFQTKAMNHFECGIVVLTYGLKT